MANYKVTDSELVSIADAIRLKGGTSASLAFPSGFVSAVQDLSVGFSVADEGKVVASGALSIQGVMSVSENSVYDTTLFSQVNVSIPEATLVSKTISENGTYYAASDSADGFSEVVVDVSGGGENGNYLIAFGLSSGSIIDSEITSINKYAFYNRHSAYGYSMNGFVGLNVLSIGDSAFGNCDLQEASFPICKRIESNAFAYCEALRRLSLPKCEYIGGYAFTNCKKIESAYLPECKIISESAFRNCTSISTLYLQKCEFINKSAFYSCSKLEKIYVLTSSIPSIFNTDVFYGTALTNSTYTGNYGSIYVFESMVDSFKTANHWSYYSERIVAYSE